MVTGRRGQHTLNHVSGAGLDVLERAHDLSLHWAFGGSDGKSQNTRLMPGGDRGSIGKSSKGNGEGEKSGNHDSYQTNGMGTW